MFFCFGIYAILVWEEFKNKELYWIVNMVLIILPFFSMGLWNDMVMKGGIPLLFFMMIFICDFLNLKSNSKKVVIRKILCCGCIIISACIMQKEWLTDISSSGTFGKNRADSYGTLENFANRSLLISEDLQYNYYSYDLDTNIFYKYISKK